MTTTATSVKRRLLVAAPVVLVLVALAAFAANRAVSWHHSVDEDHAGEAAVAAAKKEVTALTTVSAAHPAADVARLLDGATAGFRDQFKKQADAFVKALKSGKVTSTGQIASAGLVSLDGDHASVIVAATGSVKNKQTAKAQPRDYRLRAGMQRVGDTWLVSSLEFVA